PLHGAGGGVFQCTLLGEESIEVATDVGVLCHVPTSFMRRSASSISARGVVCDFFTNPWSRTILLLTTVKNTRAIPSGILLRISHRPGVILRTTGIPIGHPSWTVLMSTPIAFL